MNYFRTAYKKYTKWATKENLPDIDWLLLLADLEKNKMTPNNQKTICVALTAPTWECAGSSADSANPAGPPSSLTSWNWRSGLAPLRRPLSDADSEECLHYGNYRNALSRRWTHRCWHHHQTRTSFSKACADESMEQISRFKGSWKSYQKTNKELIQRCTVHYSSI